MLSASTGGSLFKIPCTDIEGRLADTFFGKRRPVRRAPVGSLPTGKCGTHKEGNGRVCVCALVRGARQAPCVLRFAVSANTSSFPVAFARFRFGERRGGRACAELEGEVGRRHRRQRIGTQACFWEGGKSPFFYKRNFEVIIKCINRQLRIR